MADVEATHELGLNEQIVIRKEKLQALRQANQAYRNDFRRDHYAMDLHNEFSHADTEVLEKQNKVVKISGRIITRRIMGKASFVHVQDMSGRIQLYLKKDELIENQYEQFKDWDLGDIIGAEGVLFKTKSGELSIKVHKIYLLTKALQPLPDKFHGLADQEQRYRQRYLDLVSNERTRWVFEIRSKVINIIRQFLTERRFLEVETPMMQSIPGGAAARPFSTHHNALDMELFLRISPELYLKRLLVGGFERVFEINRNFRNEGLSTRHNPEFTMLEYYEAYADYEDAMNVLEEMIRTLVEKVFGKMQLIYQNQEYDLSKPFTRMTIKEALLRFNPQLNSADLDNLGKIIEYAKTLGISVHEHYGLGKVQYEIFEKTVEANLIEPTFITAFPTEVSPLARKNEKDPFVTDRFELFIGGRELANGFSELNDPDDQAERFKDQVKARDDGDLEAMLFDADYITALEYGMPPAAGVGVGIDRLVMFLTDSPSIRDVILFPQLRSQV